MKVGKKTKKIVKGRAAGIVLEDLDSKIDLVIERFDQVEQNLGAQIAQVREEVSNVREEVIGIHVAVRKIGDRVDTHEEEIQSLKTALRQ